MNIFAQLYHDFWRELYVKSLKKHGEIEELKKRKITVLSNNCLAGMIYHNYGLPFQSMMINLQVSPEDFLKLIENIYYYLECELSECLSPDIEKFKKLGGEQIEFPVGYLEDLIIYFQHYKSFGQAKEKWEERKKRVNTNELRVVLVDTFCTKAEIERFEKIPYKKLFLTGNEENAKLLRTDEVFFMKNMRKGDWWHSVDNKDIFLRRYYEKFDFVHWMLD